MRLIFACIEANKQKKNKASKHPLYLDKQKQTTCNKKFWNNWKVRIRIAGRLLFLSERKFAYLKCSVFLQEFIYILIDKINETFRDPIMIFLIILFLVLIIRHNYYFSLWVSRMHGNRMMMALVNIFWNGELVLCIKFYNTRWKIIIRW